MSSQHKVYLSPSLTTDAAVVRTNKEGKREVLLIKRGHPPFEGHLAFPGGFVEYGEDPKDGCIRELLEETNLVGKSELLRLIGVYGHPSRDPRKHIVTIFYLVEVEDFDRLKAGDDAADAHFYSMDELLKNPDRLAFDHAQLLTDLQKLLCTKTVTTC